MDRIKVAKWFAQLARYTKKFGRFSRKNSQDKIAVALIEYFYLAYLYTKKLPKGNTKNWIIYTLQHSPLERGSTIKKQPHNQFKIKYLKALYLYQPKRYILALATTNDLASLFINISDTLQSNRRLKINN